MKSLVFTFILVIFLTNCNDKINDVEVFIDPLQDGEFVLTIDRVANSPDVQFPTTELQESDYTPFPEVKEYIVTFSENGQQVTITSNVDSGTADSLIGTMEQSTTDKAYFNITSGTFAGGRLVVWEKDKKLHCELTIYGAGVPIIMSERGLLSVLY